MGTVGLLIVAVLLPTALGYSVVAARRVRTFYDDRRDPLPLPPLERIRADLRRLHDQLAEIENAPSDHPAKFHRCQATRAAYVDVLSDACRHLQVALPEGRPVSRAEIYRAEAALRLQGLDVRPVG